MMRLAAKAIAISLLATSCAATQRDYDFLVHHALLALDRDADIQVVVLAPTLPEQAERAAAKHYRTMKQADITRVPGYDLAPGLAILQSVTFNGREAHVRIQTGPIWTGANLDCGGNHDLAYHKTLSGWQPGDIETMMC